MLCGQTAKIKTAKKLHGIDLLGDDLIGAGKIKGFFRKVGKFTSKITTAAAKAAAGMIGIPPSAIDALAKIDPTASKALAQKLVPPAEDKKTLFTPINIGIAGSAAVLLIFAISKKRRRQ